MQKKYLSKMSLILSCIVALALFSSGCIVRTYTVVKDREDQSIAGNRGYIQGNVPASVQKERPAKTTRTIRVTEIELKSPIQFQKGIPPQLGDKTAASSLKEEGALATQEAVSTGEVITYKVEKGDTLQKISMKFFGTTKKWPKIFQDNKELLKSPEKIYTGQVIKIVK